MRLSTLLGIEPPRVWLRRQRRMLELRRRGLPLPWDTRLYVDDQTRLSFGRDCVVFRGIVLMLWHGELTLGEGVTLGDYCNLREYLSFIRVGSRTGIGQFVSIPSANHLVGDTGVPDWHEHDLREGKHGVTIGDDCWIGAHSIILPGVTIGDRVTVAAGSVVTHDIPSGSVVIGAPGQVLRTYPPGTPLVTG